VDSPAFTGCIVTSRQTFDAQGRDSWFRYRYGARTKMKTVVFLFSSKRDTSYACVRPFETKIRRRTTTVWRKNYHEKRAVWWNARLRKGLGALDKSPRVRALGQPRVVEHDWKFPVRTTTSGPDANMIDFGKFSSLCRSRAFFVVRRYPSVATRVSSAFTTRFLRR